MRDNATEEILLANFFGPSARALLQDLFAAGVVPIVYAFREGKERFSFIPGACTAGMRAFLDTRRGDARWNAVGTTEELWAGDVFYITCIDEPEKLAPLYGRYRSAHHCVYQRDIYTHDQWLEIMPRAATKANAIRQLQQKYGCDRLVVFGDGKNDIDMFAIADESYAVANAHPDLMRRATGVIASNDEDGVARWLAERLL